MRRCTSSTPIARGWHCFFSFSGVRTLTERYRFDDRGVGELRWRIERQGDGRYVGSEPRLVGTARGEQAGNAFHWVYKRRLPQGDRLVAFDDWFWPQEGGVLISRASLSRFGIELATMSVFYRPVTD